jgi:uncharacterized protein YbaR (Trm112 family)
MAGEIAYINNGEIYKEHTFFSGPMTGDDFNYIPNRTDDPIAPFAHIKGLKEKRYTSTREFREWLLNESTGSPLEGYDLCPAVDMWLGEGKFTDDTPEIDLYFKVNDSVMLQAVADYYGLPYPINSDITNMLDNNLRTISMYQNGSEYLALGVVKIIDSIPTLLKFHCYYKEIGDWVAFEKGRSLSDGNVIEEGGRYALMSTKPIHHASTSGDNVVTEYVEDKTDPITQWEAHRTNLATNETKIEHYESSRALRLGVGNLNTGTNYEEYDRAPSVNMWLGRSWIENEHEELYFLVESREMLDEVATYYGLPVPYDDEMKVVLDNNLQSIRFKSYDLNNEGEGNFVAVVVASITFVNDTATTLKLYETTRWNE